MTKPKPHPSDIARTMSLIDPKDREAELARLQEAAEQQEQAEHDRRRQAALALAAAQARLLGAEWVRVQDVAAVVAEGDVLGRASRVHDALLAGAAALCLPVRATDPPHEPVDASSLEGFGLLLAVLWWQDANRVLAEHIRHPLRVTGPVPADAAAPHAAAVQRRTKPERAASGEASERSLKRIAMVAELEGRWPTIKADLSEASRNGLAQAKDGERAGMWLPDVAVAWAASKGKLRSDGPQVPGPRWPTTPRRVHRAK